MCGVGMRHGAFHVDLEMGSDCTHCRHIWRSTRICVTFSGLVHMMANIPMLALPTTGVNECLSRYPSARILISKNNRNSIPSSPFHRMHVCSVFKPYVPTFPVTVVLIWDL